MPCNDCFLPADGAFFKRVTSSFRATVWSVLIFSCCKEAGNFYSLTPKHVKKINTMCSKWKMKSKQMEQIPITCKSRKITNLEQNAEQGLEFGFKKKFKKKENS